MTGAWTDVFVLPDGRLGQVAVDGAAVSCEIEGIPTWTQRASEALLFCRCAVHQGLVLSIHQGHDTGRAWLVGPGMVRDLGPTFGVQPVAIDSRFAYVVRSGYTYDQIDLETGETRSMASPVPGSSQGISDVTPDGLWWADLHRSLVVNGVTFTYPNVRGPVTVGQADPPRIAAALNGTVSTVFAGDGYEPHVAVSGPRAAVCARTPHLAAYAVLSTIEKVPGPIVKKEEDPMFLPPKVLANIQSLYQAHRALAHGTDDQRRQLTQKIAEQAVFDFPADGYGWKSSSPTNPPSKDSIARRVGGRLYSWDLFNGATREPWPNPEGEDITGQHFINVSGVNHLGGAVPDPVKPPPVVVPPPPGKSRDEMRAAFTELIRFYNEPDGLNRAARGLPSPVVFHDRGIEDWFALAAVLPIEDVKKQIAQHAEYKDQHR